VVGSGTRISASRLLVPVLLLVAERSGVPLLEVGLPALAGLSVLHGLVPPHPGPLAAIALLHADLGPHPALRARHRRTRGAARRCSA